LKDLFSGYCGNSKSIFTKVYENNLLELFFDVDSVKLKEFISSSIIQELFKKHNLVLLR